MQHLSEGTLLQGGKFKIEKMLGQGGFGITYLASQTISVEGSIGEIKTEIKLAIKEFFMKDVCNRNEDSNIVSVPSVGSKELVERFKQKFIKEARSISKLKHPHIVKVVDIFEENGTAYYVMEYHNGGSLGDLVKDGNPLPEADAVRYITQIADAVGYIHKQKINHLDIKPGNILLDGKSNGILIDFGLSKQYDEQGSQTSSTPVGISHGYAPMEQYKQNGVSTFSPQSDIYSLGATLYKLVTGVTPPQAMDIFNDGLPALPAHLSDGVKKAIEQAMQLHKNDRPATAEEFIALLSSDAAVVVPAVEPAADESTKIIAQPSEETLVEEPVEKPIEKPTPEPVKPAAPEKKEPETPEKPIEESSEENKKNAWLWVAVVVVASILGVFVWQSQSTDVKTPEEAYNIGRDYYNGTNGKQKDYSEAVKWYRKAAEQGHAGAQNNLGLCYKNGQGVPQDYSEAVKWYRRATEQGHARAQNNLGVCYQKGEGVPQDYSEAVKWFRKVAEQGYAGAQYNLGVCYYNGKGVPLDYSEGVKWFRKAAEQGHAGAQKGLGLCYKNGRGVPKDYSEAVKWYHKSAEQGDADAQYYLGLCYYEGQGVPQDYSEVVKWNRKAAEQGHAPAQRNLGVCYYNGWGVPQDYSEAVKWYRKAAEQGYADVQSSLGYCYEKGLGVPQDYSEAVKWYRKAAEQGNEDAKEQLQELQEMGY